MNENEYKKILDALVARKTRLTFANYAITSFKILAIITSLLLILIAVLSLYYPAFQRPAPLRAVALYAMSAGFAALLGFAWSRLNRPSAADVAADVEGLYPFKQTFVTAIEYSAGGKDTALREELMAKAAEQARSVVAKRVYKRRPIFGHYITLISLALVLTFTPIYAIRRAVKILDKEPPRVADIAPADGRLNVPVDVNILIEFTEPIAPETVNENTVTLAEFGSPDPVKYELHWGSGYKSLILAPVSPLTHDRLYSVQIVPCESGDLPVQTVTDFAGNRFNPYPETRFPTFYVSTFITAKKRTARVPNMAALPDGNDVEEPPVTPDSEEEDGALDSSSGLEIRSAQPDSSGNDGTVSAASGPAENENPPDSIDPVPDNEEVPGGGTDPDLMGEPERTEAELVRKYTRPLFDPEGGAQIVLEPPTETGGEQSPEAIKTKPPADEPIKTPDIELREHYEKVVRDFAERRGIPREYREYLIEYFKALERGHSSPR